jgi:hypothetical protein
MKTRKRTIKKKQSKKQTKQTKQGKQSKHKRDEILIQKGGGKIKDRFNEIIKQIAELVKDHFNYFYGIWPTLPDECQMEWQAKMSSKVASSNIGEVAYTAVATG